MAVDPTSALASSSKAPSKESETPVYAKKATGETSRKKSKKTAAKHTSLAQPHPRADLHSKPDRKTAYRTVLDNPLTIEWPAVPLNIENAVLACAVDLLESVRSYHEQRDTRNHRRRSGSRAAARNEKIAIQRSQKAANKPAATDVAMDVATTETDQSSRKRKRTEKSDAEIESVDGAQAASSPVSVKSPPPKRRRQEEIPSQPLAGPPDTAPAPPDLTHPEMLDHVIIGINEVTKRLEAQSRSLREAPPTSPNALSTPTPRPIRLVIICRTDIDSPTMIAHFPTLVAACNSAPRPETGDAVPEVVMVALPHGAESALSEGAGLRRAAVIAFDVTTPGLNDRIEPFLESIPILKASWLAVGITPTPATTLVPTHIKHVKTTVPKDIKIAKVQRTEERKEKKKRRSETRRLDKVVVSAAREDRGKVIGTAKVKKRDQGDKGNKGKSGDTEHEEIAAGA